MYTPGHYYDYTDDDFLNISAISDRYSTEVGYVDFTDPVPELKAIDIKEQESLINSSSNILSEIKKTNKAVEVPIIEEEKQQGSGFMNDDEVEMPHDPLEMLKAKLQGNKRRKRKK